MVGEKQSRTKTQSLSLRLDPKTRFILEFMARIRGQNITVIVERAIKEAAGQVGITSVVDSFGRATEAKHWNDFWDPDEGVRTLKLLADSDYPTTYEEDEIRKFTVDHWEFFYSSSAAHTVRSAYVGLLWPRLEKYLKTWKSTRSEDYWAAGKQMAADLKSAGLSAPLWPRTLQPLQAPKTETRASSSVRDLDDEVPF